MSPYVDCVRAYTRGNGVFYAFDAGLHATLLFAWKGGQTFFTGTSIDGDEITIKLAEVESVMYCTSASLETAFARLRAEEKASERETFE